ncbi:hypothetical protein S40285_00801 [Stachybotrys chlorohalonatus IBT 40285]|uniref:Fungal lipase-type domain-containing protein n=1 Tax=Stachybotrys chlorohalonatus (strain IBT 40285) TaxID=1283841 RepID=A0A084QJH5_STAC4|nr:hypothetical protein S40285_00801 [Stachybotrys chlorohalonata IBT 40285]
MSRAIAMLFGVVFLCLVPNLPTLALSPNPVSSHGSPVNAKEVSPYLFADLERLARLVDISYCIGSTGITKPFQCVSRCDEFPTLSLVATWNTGILLSDSCGYIAVDHGTAQPSSSDEDMDNGGDRGAIIVAFRGTYSITNTVIDLSTVPQQYVPYPSPDDGGDRPEKPHHKCTNCTVHMGFLQSWRNARTLVLPDLIELKAQYPSYPIQLVGHSLGGSVACLAALELKVSLGWDDITVTTFGEPRTGNYQLARFVDEVFELDGEALLDRRSYRRVTHNNDPVPLLPLDEWGYRSHAGEIYIAKKDLPPTEQDIHICIGDEDPNCSASESGTNGLVRQEQQGGEAEMAGFPTRFKIWQLLFAHRDYFWRLGLCVPGGDPFNWGRPRYETPDIDEL